MNQQIRVQWDRALNYWRSLEMSQKRNVIIAVVIVLITASLLSWFATRPNYVVVFRNLDDKSAGQIVNKLQTDLKVPYELSGNTISVPAAQADNVRLQLATAGLPQSGYIGYNDIFQQNNFGMTQDQFNVKVLAALEGSIAQTIESINGVQSVQVHLVMPADQLFVAQQQNDAKASVLVTMKPGATLAPAVVGGIEQLVAHSVQGLTPDNVTVVDQNGVRQNAQTGASDTSLNSVADRQLQIESELETQLSTQLRNGLEHVVGVGNVTVMVHANLSFDQVKSQNHTVTPVLKDSGIPISEQLTQQSSTGAAPAGGVAGTSTNGGAGTGLSTVQSPSTGNSSSQSKSSTTNYDVNKTDTQTVGAPFHIQQYTVSVLLNGSTNLQLDNVLKNYVATAIGDRNDGSANPQITVASYKFQTAANPFSQSNFFTSALGIAAAVVGGLLIGGAVVAFVRRRRKSSLTGEPIIMPPALEGMPESPEHRIKSQLEKMARQKPEDFANLLRTWLLEE